GQGGLVVRVGLRGMWQIDDFGTLSLQHPSQCLHPGLTDSRKTQVGQTKEIVLGDPEHPHRLPRLCLPDRPGLVRVGALDAAFPRGQKDNPDALAWVAVQADGAAAADRFIVRMRRHHEDCRHYLGPPRPARASRPLMTLSESKCSLAMARAATP